MFCSPGLQLNQLISCPFWPVSTRKPLSMCSFELGRPFEGAGASDASAGAPVAGGAGGCRLGAMDGVG